METADRHSLRRGIIVALLFLLLLQSTSAMRDLKGPGGFNIILGTMKEMANNPPGPNEWKIWQIEDVDSAGNRKSTGFFYFDFGRNQAAAVRGDFEKGVGGMTAFWSPPPVLRNNTAANAISNWASQSYGRGPGSQVWGIGLTNPDFIPEGHPPSYEAGATRSMVIAHEKGHYDLLAHPQLQQYVQQFWNDLGPDGQAELRSAMGKRLNEMADPRVAQQIMSDSPTGSSGIATEIFLRTLESPEAG